MNKILNKLCKTCAINPRHTGRTECISCITQKNWQKAKEQQKNKKEKQVIQKKMKTEKKRFSRSNLIKEADRVFSLFIRERDRGKPCITCGKSWTPTAQCGHFISRSYLKTRWTEKNAHGQCPQCNCWGGGHQYTHGIEVDNLYGEGTAQRLYLYSQQIGKITDQEIVDIIQKYYILLTQFGIDFKPKKYYLGK